MLRKRGKLCFILLVFLFLAMGNTAPPNAPCLDKQLGDLCTPVGFMSCRNGGRCQHMENSGFRDDPNTTHDESLICIEGATQPESPTKPSK